MASSRGRFFVVEGIDGSGKSTLVQVLHDYAHSIGHTVVMTREPGATPLGLRLRTIVQESKSTLDSQAEFLLFAADRAQHVHHVIKPALEQGILVISDRFKYSSLAYQGYGRGLDKQFITMVNDHITKDVEPEVIFYCALDAEVALARCVQRGEKQTRFEAAGIDFLKRVQHGFEEMFAHNPRVIRIDATASKEHMHQQAVEAFKKVLAS